MVRTTHDRNELRAERRDAFLGATRELIEEIGLDALTVKSVAERVDCAVGTLYTYFPSKEALIAAVQVEAIERLHQAYLSVADRLEDDLESLSVDVDTAAIARLVAFGRSAIEVAEVLPDEFKLQQRLLSSQTGYTDEELAMVTPVVFSVLAQPERLLREAASLGAISEGDAFDRTVIWLAGINGILALSALSRPATDGFDPRSFADQLSLDLLTAWGASPITVTAASHAAPRERIAALLVQEQ